ncbi:hypothetical protein SOVF_197380 [Spinacia oleracea]|uniref:Uncharacterized protein At5g39865 n=1 Tax=Spinacia oleracea TaxID=3562 RepID=A0A9R0HSZ1_SPIOL|nr:uncharacterized protein At5g39865 [Spinacia oleracea]KNA04687.1 hypothetical protein SOVF_197380 [Spinacia oleracea]
MWPSWGKSSQKISDTPKHKFQSSNFRCSSFKDIENLCNFDLDFPISSSPNTTNTTLKRQPSVPTQPRTCRAVFHRVRTANSLLQQWASRSNPPKPENTPTRATPGSLTETSPKIPSPDARIVVYYTSLRIVRPTFQACRAVMSILQGFQVVIDERDLAMDSSFMSELRELLGLKPTEQLALPRVFIGGRYVGGADEVKYLHEIGELKKLVSGIPPKKPGTCHTCGGYRFILCAECSGSHKIFSEKIGFRTCSACNENGLIRCLDCSSPPFRRPILMAAD